MKKMTNVEVKVINLEANDIVTASPNNAVGDGTILVGARGYYEDEEEIW